MKGRPSWEILVGSSVTLDWLAEPGEREDHPLQLILEEFVETQLTDEEQEMFFMRYGEQLPIRTIARRLGYSSHYVIQVQLERLEAKAREWLSDRIGRNAESDN